MNIRNRYQPAASQPSAFGRILGPLNPVARHISGDSRSRCSLKAPEGSTAVTRDLVSGEKSASESDHEDNNGPKDKKIVHRNYLCCNTFNLIKSGQKRQLPSDDFFCCRSGQQINSPRSEEHT